MKTVVYGVYSAESDMTFVMEEVIDDAGELHSTEVKGFYYGKGDAKLNGEYYGKTFAQHN